MNKYGEYEPVLPKPIELLCGSVAEFDIDSGISYRCRSCFAVIGSVGMPKRCKELYEMEKIVSKLKGKQ
jgi:hypothetical protein